MACCRDDQDGRRADRGTGALRPRRLLRLGRAVHDDDHLGCRRSGGASDNAATAGSGGPTPCPDFVGFVHNGRVLSAPLNQGAINGRATQIAGNFDRASATALARALNGGTLPVPLRVVSVSTGS